MTWLEELDLDTGSWRTVESVPGTLPSETMTSYSPDGRFIAYGTGRTDAPEESEGDVRVTDLTTRHARTLPDLTLVYGDPWQDDHTVLAMTYDEQPFALFDAATGDRSSVGIDNVMGLGGYVDGRLVLDRTAWLDDRTKPCLVALCLADPATHVVTPWLDMRGGALSEVVTVARDIQALPPLR